MDERKEFEDAMHVKHPEWAFTPDPVFGYHNERTRLAWEGWQARAALSSQCAAGEAEPVAFPSDEEINDLWHRKVGTPATIGVRLFAFALLRAAASPLPIHQQKDDGGVPGTSIAEPRLGFPTPEVCNGCGAIEANGEAHRTTCGVEGRKP